MKVEQKVLEDNEERIRTEEIPKETNLKAENGKLTLVKSVVRYRPR
ncbi:MAG: hypothetical protein GY861_14095 [bacterium]|nr:hypothetical protein [bacterium]